VTPSELRERDFRRILLIKLSAVGDVIHTIPVLAKLRARYPNAQIDWVITPAIGEFVRHHPALSRVLPFDPRWLGKAWRSRSAARAFFGLLGELRRARYDLVIDMHGQFRTAVLARATGAPVRVGFDRPRGKPPGDTRPVPASAYRHGWTGARELSWLAYTHRISIPTLEAHAVDRYLWVGQLLGFPDGPADFSIPLPPAAESSVDTLLAEAGVAGRPLVLLFPATQWETKHWSSEGFATVGRHLAARGMAVVLAGSPAERDRCRAVALACPGAVDLCGRTSLTELAVLVRRSAICVTNDSGPMHLAVAMQRPVVAIFGPTDALWIGPYGRSNAVAQAGLPCSPCYLRRVSRCPNGHACMRDVTPQRVIDLVEAALSGRIPLHLGEQAV
jgi:heptosyltransferase-1